jgi:hypothetical protein
LDTFLEFALGLHRRHEPALVEALLTQISPDVTGLGYPSLTGRNVAATLTNFSLVYAYHAADTLDPWKLYDVAAPSWVNDLPTLTSEWGYWVRATTTHDWSVAY